MSIDKVLYEKVLSVTCPYCKAVIDEDCINTTTKKYMDVRHSSRYELYRNCSKEND